MASGGRMLLLHGRGLKLSSGLSRAAALMQRQQQPQRRSIYADPQGKSYEREGLVMYVLCLASCVEPSSGIDALDEQGSIATSAQPKRTTGRALCAPSGRPPSQWTSCRGK